MTDTMTYDTSTVESTINKWIVEATSNYNDGWTRLHYTKQLSEIKERLNSLEFLNKDKIKEQYGEENIDQ
jgi:hypothetical protein